MSSTMSTTASSSATGLSEPGSATYDSDTMHVGDGTWDSERDDFLLPNLVGLNYATMRYNGMGNRFKSDTQYHRLIIAHGVLAAIVFLALVPTAILVAKFYWRDRRLALRIHMWCSILTLLISTAVFMLGFFAVGLKRSLTNPHHAIGLAIYLGIWVQFIWGFAAYMREKRRREMPKVLPLKLMIHQWFGRGLALLGIAQLPMGLYLYGSPAWLFILFAIAGAALFILYFVLCRWQMVREGREYGSVYSYGTRSEILSEEGTRSRRGLGRFAKPLAAGAGLAALGNSLRRRSGKHTGREGEVIGSHTSESHSQVPESYVGSEKTAKGRGESGAGAAAAAGAGIGLIAAMKRLFGRRREEDYGSEYYSTEYSSQYRYPPSQAPSGNPSGLPSGTEDDSVSRVNRLEEGRPMSSTVSRLGAQSNPERAPLNHQRSVSSASYSSYYTGAPTEEKKTHGFRDAVLGLGVLTGIRDMMRRRREAREQRRLDDIHRRDLEDERMAREQNRRYAGDDYSRGDEESSITDTEPTSSVITGPQTTSTGAAVPPIPVITHDSATDSAARRHQGRLPRSSARAGQEGNVAAESSISALDHSYTASANTQEASAAAAGAAGAATGAVVGSALVSSRHSRSASRDQSRRRNRQRSESATSASGNERSAVASPPVSVKVKVRNDGRQVTLRRLTEAEAAANREARRQARRQDRPRRRLGSTSSISGTDTPDRWRRVENMERQQEIERLQEQQQQRQQPSLGLSPTSPPGQGQGSFSAGARPSIPGALGSVGSPTGTYDMTGTDASADYANNRRRRRAERAQPRGQARRAGGGSTVEFT